MSMLIVRSHEESLGRWIDPERLWRRLSWFSSRGQECVTTTSTVCRKDDFMLPESDTWETEWKQANGTNAVREDLSVRMTHGCA